MAIFQQLRALGRRYLPPSLARGAKRLMVWPRYAVRARACRKAFAEYGDKYPQKILFATGLPKSGTTWLVRLITSYPGFYDDVVIPDIARDEINRGGSHTLDLPADMFARFSNMLIFTKMHVPASAHNLKLLHEANVHYVVMHRDLRDVAVSYYFYVRRTPWHPDFGAYRDLDVEAGLLRFAERTLGEYADWVRDWHESMHPELGLEVRYEDMLADPFRMMTQVAKHYQLDSSPETIKKIVDAQQFERASGGRTAGESSEKSHLRKGIAGDWRNHFTPAVTDRYKQIIGTFLIDFNYESDENW